MGGDSPLDGAVQPNRVASPSMIWSRSGCCWTSGCCGSWPARSLVGPRADLLDNEGNVDSDLDAVLSGSRCAGVNSVCGLGRSPTSLIG